ncbi:MAG: hypothetical protein M0R70_12500 [Nitrospirae bacterium]|nr:hypothetical protein [Nitrospirota bacterium]
MAAWWLPACLMTGRGATRYLFGSQKRTKLLPPDACQVVANWLIGREIVEEEQQGSKKAQYGKKLITDLSDPIGSRNPQR